MHQNRTIFNLRRSWGRTRPANTHGSHVPRNFEARFDGYHPIAQGLPSHRRLENVDRILKIKTRIQRGSTIEQISLHQSTKFRHCLATTSTINFEHW